MPYVTLKYDSGLAGFPEAALSAAEAGGARQGGAAVRPFAGLGAETSRRTVYGPVAGGRKERNAQR